MLILRHYFPQGVKKEELQKTIKAFTDKYFAATATISGFKYDTIVHIWNNRESLFQKIKQAAKGDDIKLLSALLPIPGVAPVKAGFMAQLIFGRSGCLDTHNIDIYTKVYPDLEPELNMSKWQKDTSPRADKKNLEALKRYSSTLKKLNKRGIGTKELWDVWVDFVGNMYRMIVEGGHGLYGNLEPALNPNDPKYQDLKTDINKMKITAAGKKAGGIVSVPTISGVGAGGGAGATHTIAAKDPIDILSALSRGEDAPYWAKAIDRTVDPKTGNPYNKIMGGEPAATHYFGKALDSKGKVDIDRLKRIIKNRVSDKQASDEARPLQRGLF